MTERQKRRLEARRLAKQANKEISPAQLAANQANSQLSTGPSSIEGKAISSQNNFRHGLTQTESDLTFLEGESKEAYLKVSVCPTPDWTFPPSYVFAEFIEPRPRRKASVCWPV